MTGEIYIDGCGFNILSESAVVISGLHDRLLEAINTDKQIVVTNLFWGTIPVTPIPVFAINFGGNDGIYCTASTLQIRVSPTDVVTVYNMAPEE